MGTSYYARYNACECCGRYDEAHIGKSFRTLQAYDQTPFTPIPGYERTAIIDMADWRTVLALPGVTVWDEYGEQVTDVAAFVARWQRWETEDEWRQDPAHLGASRYSNYHRHCPVSMWLDPEGHVMWDTYFS
jgi:hypothetical protein